MQTKTPPSLKSQADIYKDTIERMKGKTVIIRLLDTGADKPLPYWPLTKEDNPFLGVRGIRLLLKNEKIVRTQLQAILIASEKGSVGIMIPMVDSLKPIERVKNIIEEEKINVNWNSPNNLTLGVMIETPAAVQLIDDILDIVDFISIGTNDLTQYTLAVDRGNPLMNEYYDEFHPSVLRSIAQVITHANKKHKLNSICGELAGDILALPFFIGLGVKELSTNATSILKLKKIIRNIDSTEAKNLVTEILKASTSEDIKKRLKEFLNERNLLMFMK